MYMLSVEAFAPTKTSVSSTVLNARSRALPFLEAPKKLDGSTVGDFGFDPLGLTDTLNDLHYVRSAEIKHCRVAMLAVVGFLVQQNIHILNGEADPIKAVSALGLGPNLQILSFIGVIELATWQKTFFGNDPGNLGFDPLGFGKGKSVQQYNDLKLKEIKNGRLAMIAIIGLLFQNVAFDGRPSLLF
eukprot:CAMPEP_0173147530 /NCGR_PEP_ID=MMETSP1105-20130129/9188_1 /TAXON_ID=2985 /ORGANISM="Ochromonas sp., Strain BG-1" /LENGTH=186 /DNA_ID=CAMNT_0014062029 /DNA_START=114 /DNA_END=674 /DNA_ORIENTATION=-